MIQLYNIYLYVLYLNCNGKYVILKYMAVSAASNLTGMTGYTHMQTYWQVDANTIIHTLSSVC